MSTCANTQNPLSGKDLVLKIGNGFEGAVTFQNAGDTVTKNAHGLAADTPVMFSAITGPTTIVIDTIYYVVNPLTNTFQLAATPGGSVITLDVDGTGTAEEAFVTIGGIQSATISLAASLQEITNRLSNQFREILDMSGIKSMSLAGNGIAVDDWSALKLRQIFQDQEINRFQAFIDDDSSSTLKYWEGCFKATALEFSGENDAPQNFSITLESSGEFSYNEV